MRTSAADPFATRAHRASCLLQSDFNSRGRAVDTDTLKAWVCVALRAPSADNSQPWRCEWDGHELVVAHRPTSGVDPFGPGGHAVLLSAGCVAANLVDTLVGLGVEHTVTTADSPERGTPYFKVRIQGDLRMPAACNTLPAALRHTNRFPFAENEIPAGILEAIAGAREASVRVVAIGDPTARSALTSIAKRCAQARFCTQELHEWLTASLRATPDTVAAGDGLDLATLCLPPGGRAFLRATSDWRVMRALNSLGAYKILAASDTALLRGARLLLCVVGTGDAAGTLAAGRALARVWTDLNVAGLAVHPYYVVTDQMLRLASGRVPEPWRDPVSEAVDRLPPLLDLGPGEIMHMILRVGWPTVVPKRSQRLPIDRVFRDLTGEQHGPTGAVG